MTTRLLAAILARAFLNDTVVVSKASARQGLISG
jgi:hypothetical protein